MLVDVYTKDGAIAGQIELRDDVFAIEPSEDAMHQAVVTYLAHQRQGTHKTKTKSEVSGGGKKPWRQKGRGTARAGSIRSPLWVGGGTIHGPQPHKYNLKITKNLRKLARKSALSLRLAENNIKIVEDFELPEIKTKNMANILQKLELEYEKTLILTSKFDSTMLLSARNIPFVSVYPADMISAYNILTHNKLLIFKSAVETIEKIY